jgi:predicted ribosomally synthesized peptide with SipW-like signal peptide
MKILLTILVVCAIATAGISGTLADFSDSEEEKGDTLQAGSMDLKVDGYDDPLPPWCRYIFRNCVPGKSYHIWKTVANNGTIDGHLYIHFKSVNCTDTDDKGFKPEPEYVAENGGWVGQKWVDGIGTDNACDMPEHIKVDIRYGTPPSAPPGSFTSVNLTAYDANGDGHIKLSELECQQIYLGVLPQCGAEYQVRIELIIQDVDESYYGFDYFNVGDPHEIKWNWWPTNAMMGDTVTFDILFELLQTDYTPPGGG